MALTTANLSGVVINEVGTSPNIPAHDLNGDGLGNGDDEFVEIFNTSGSAVDISGWELWILDGNITPGTTSGHMHTFAGGTTLGAGQSLVIVDPVNTAGTLNLANSVYAVPEPSGSQGTPTFFSLTDGDIVILYNPVADQYVQFSGEDSNVTTDAQDVVDSFFGSSTLVGSIEFGVEDNAGNSAQRQTDGDETWIDAPQTAGAPNCFAAGTMIRTDAGETAIEDLSIGDVVLAADGAAHPVRWIARQSAHKLLSGAHMQPVRIRAGALGAGLPHRDLVVTADHGMIVDDLLVNASALVNGADIDYVPGAELPGRITYFHVETDAHVALVANGAAAESFVDYTGRDALDNYEEYLALYGSERIIPEMPLTRISARRQLPQALRERFGLRDADTEHALSA